MEWLHEEDDSVLDDPDFAKTFAQHFLERRYEKSLAAMERKVEYWLQMGLSKARIDERADDIDVYYDNADKESDDTERQSLEKLINYKQTKLNEINEILADLTLPEYVVPSDASLLKVAKLLHFKYEDLIQVKRERLNQLTELKSKRAKLCSIMKMDAKSFSTVTNIPSEEELMRLQSYVSDLAKEKAKRFKAYETKKKMIEDLFIELEREISNDFEKEILFEQMDKFILSDDNMKRIHNLHSELESLYFNNNEKRKILDRKLIALWNRLDVSHSQRDKFLAENIGCKPSVLKVLELEVLRNEEIKRQNIQLFVLKIRTELDEWYEKCCASDSDKLNFMQFMESEDFSEQLLEIHEQELERLKSLYEECDALYAKLNEWRRLWTRLHELENKMNDPNRLNNRGGALLIEERERKQSHKGLPKIEKEVHLMSKRRFDATGRKFLVYGMEIDKYFEDQWSEYHATKENEKKKRQRDKQLDIQAQLKGKKVTPMGGIVMRKTPVKRAFTPMSPNCDSASKMRKLGCAPLTPSSLANDNINRNTITKRSEIPNNVPTAKPRARNLAQQLNQVAHNGVNNAVDYEGSLLSINEDEFQAPLCERENVNSTFISVSRKVTPEKRNNITKRRNNGLNRRKSRSCSDLANAVKTQLQIGNKLITVNSTPSSPQPKSYATPSRFPKFAVGQRKPPFIL